MAAFCPDTNSKEFLEIENALNCNSLAHFIWKENKGNPIDSAPNGKTSYLFKDLLEVHGERSKAIIEKCKAYTYAFRKNFGDWVNESYGIFPDSIFQETVYHGSNVRNINVFKSEFEGTSHQGRGFNFAFTKEEAKTYGKYVYPVKLNIKKWVVTDKEAKTIEGSGIHDVDEIVVYDSDQIRILNTDENGEPFVESLYLTQDDVDKIHPDPKVQTNINKYGLPTINDWNNQYVWDIENELGLIEWKGTKKYISFHKLRAEQLAKKAKEMGADDAYVQGVQTINGESRWRLKLRKKVGLPNTPENTVFSTEANTKLERILSVMYSEIELGKVYDSSHPNLRGQANIPAMSVLINYLERKQDTLPHEYAHHYIAWFSNAPIVKEAIKKWGSEEKLVQAIGEQVVEQKGEARDLWLKFTEWIKNLFNKLSDRNKEELRDILTDAFLTGVDITTGKTITSERSIQLKNLAVKRMGNKNAMQYQKIDEEEGYIGDQDKIREALLEPAKLFTYSEKRDIWMYKKSGKPFTSVGNFMKTRNKGSAINKESRYGKINTTVQLAVKKDVEDLASSILSDLEIGISNSAIKSLSKILKEVKGQSVTMMSNVLVADMDREIIDTIDLVLIDKNGRIRIVDFQLDDKWNFKYYESPYQKTGVSNKKRKHVKLSIDKHLIEKTIDVQVFQMNVVLLNVEVNEDDVITGLTLDDYNEDGIDVFNKMDEAFRIYEEKAINFSKNHLEELLGKSLIGERQAYLKGDMKGPVQFRRDIDDLGALLTKMHENFQKRIAMMTERYSYARRQRFEDFYEDLMTKETVSESFIAIIKFSAENINKLHSEYLDILNGKASFTVETLSKWKDLLVAYADLEELQELADMDKTLIQTPQVIGTLNDAVTKKKRLERMFKTEGKKLIADWLVPYYDGIRVGFKEQMIGEWKKQYREHKKSKNVSRADIISVIGTRDEYVEKQVNASSKSLDQRTFDTLFEELSIASRDVNIIIRWFDNMLDTSDPVASAMINAFVDADTKSRWESIDKQKEVLDKIKDLEERRDKKMFQTEIDFYSFMLEITKDKPTGYLVMPWSSKLMEAERELRKKLAKTQTSEDVYLQIRNFRKENAPINWHEYNRAVSKYARFLYETTDESIKITYDEYSEIANSALEWGADIRHLLKADLISERAGDLMMAWQRKNRPYYAQLKPKWVNPQWQKLMKDVGIDTKLPMWEQNEKLRESDHYLAAFYNFILNLAEEANGYLPYGYDIGFRLPGVAKSDMERTKESLAGKYSPLKQVRETLQADFFVRPEDTERGNLEYTDEQGNVKYFLPVHYTAKLEPENQSYDLAGIYYRFWKTSNDYKNKRKILPEMEMTKFFIEQRRTIITSPFGKMLYKVRRGGNIEDDDEKQIALKESTNLAGQFSDWFRMAVYGKLSKDKSKIQLTDNIEFDFTKAADALNRFTSLNLLGLNIVQGGANVLIGEAMQAADALAGEHVSVKSLSIGTVKYSKWLPGMLGDVGSRAPVNTGSLLIQRFDIMNEEPDATMSQITKLGNLFNLSSAFFVQRAGEHWMQGRFLFARLSEKKAYDKNGNELGSMLDQFYSDNGVLKVKKEVDLNKSEWTEKDELMFFKSTKRMLSRMHGAYSHLERIAIQQYALGRLAYMFRKFVVPGFKRRWSKNQYIQLLGQSAEGDYITTGKFVIQLCKDLKTSKYAMMTEEWGLLSNHEKANVKRMLSEIAFLAAVSIMASVFYRMKGEEDDEAIERWLSMMSYQMYRLQTELLFWSPKLDESMTILRSPMASMSMIENLIKLTGQIWHPGDLYQRGPWKGKPKITKTMIHFIPFYKQYFKARDIEEQIEWFR